MSDNFGLRLNNIPPRKICEHGSQEVKCPIRENTALEAEIERDELRETIVSLRATVASYKDAIEEERNAMDAVQDRAEKAESALAALRKRIEESAIADADAVFRYMGLPIGDEWTGKRVALVVLE